MSDLDLKVRSSEAWSATMFRFAMVLPLWAPRYFLARTDTPWARAALPLMDAALLALHWWATKPVRLVEQEKFAQRGRASNLLLVPIALSGFLFVRDLWRLM